MKEVLINIIITGGFFILSIVFIIVWFFKKKKKIIIILSIIMFLISILMGINSFYLIANKSINKISEITKPRDGQEIYKALFGNDENECVEILNYQDQIIPKIDYAIWLNFTICPEECKRILSEFNYSKEELETKNWGEGTPLAENINWWNPKSMGDFINVYEYRIKEGKNIRTLWISSDSTEVYCRDILD